MTFKDYYEGFAGTTPESSKRIIVHAENHVEARVYLERTNAFAHVRPEPLPEEAIKHFLSRGTFFCEVPESQTIENLRKDKTNMTIHEFEELTGFYPSTDLYAAIEQAYDDYPGDKREFCAEYKANKDGLAEKIQYMASLQTLNALSAETAKANEAKLERDEAKRKIKELEVALEQAQGWKPHGHGSNMTDAEYLELEFVAGEHISEERAREIIHNEFGFAMDFIVIVNELTDYEINYARQLREAGTVSRLPLYHSTDWNYIRFDANGWQYEMVNGQLEFFDV